MSDATLSRLYKAQTPGKSRRRESGGYAVFSNFGMKILLAGSGTARESP